jgi:hypothetical protein
VHSGARGVLMAEEKQRIGIAHMGQHFLYLPAFYAIREQFFGHAPADILFEKHPAPRPTDDAVFDMLMDVNTVEHRAIDFAICDPAVLLRWPKGSDPAPVLLGGLVTNVAFWAVDTGRHTTRSFDDLGSFEKIIAFQSGSTSHGIASRAARKSTVSTAIVEVRPGLELATLEEVSAGASNAVALTPDVLGLLALLSRSRQFSIELELAKTPEYAGVLVTGILTRSDVLGRQRSLCIAVARAIQESLVRTQLRDPLVLAYAAEAHNTSRGEIDRALESAIDSHVFPLSIEVTQAQWLRTAESATDAAGLPFSQAKRDEATDVFHRSIQPFAADAREIFRSSVHVGGKPPVAARQPSPTADLVALIVAALAFIAGLRPLQLLGARGWILQVVGAFVVLCLVPGGLPVAEHRGTLWVLRTGVLLLAAEQLAAYAGIIPPTVDVYAASVIGGTVIIGTLVRHLTR